MHDYLGKSVTASTQILNTDTIAFSTPWRKDIADVQHCKRLIFRSIAISWKRIRSAYCYTDVRLPVSLTVRHGRQMCKNNNNTPPQNLFHIPPTQLGKSSPLSDAVFDAYFQGKDTQPHRRAFHPLHFRLLRLNGSGCWKIPTNWFPVRPRALQYNSKNDEASALPPRRW